MSLSKCLAASSVIISLLNTGIAWAFEIHFFPGQEAIHERITAEALRMVTAITSRGVKIGFSDSAINEIIAGNRETDWMLQSQRTQENHFDDEKLADGSFRVGQGLSVVQVLAEQGHREIAQTALGGYLHTLQDFYAHSNYVEVTPSLEILSFLPLGLRDPSPGAIFCHQDPSVLDTTRPGLTTGYATLVGITGIGPFGPCGNLPFGKCAHGGSFMCGGINKDSPDKSRYFGAARDLAVRHSKFYVDSLIHQIKESTPDRVKADRTLRTLMGQPEPQTAGPLGTMGFLIDVTGSMADDIDFVKAHVAQMLELNRDASQFLLTPFSDPEIGPSVVTANPNDIRNAVNGLQTPPKQGGDCPEMYYSGLIEAIGKSQANSTIIAYSDDSIPKDQDLADIARSLATAKRINVVLMPLNRDCDDEESPITPERLAAGKATLDDFNENVGGSLFDFSGIFNDTRQISGQTVRDIGQTLFSDELGAIVRKRNDQGSFTIVPVDSTVRELMFIVTNFRSEGFVLRRPSGTVWRASDAGVTVTSVLDVANSSPRDPVYVLLFIRIKAPMPGDWQLSVYPDGRSGGRPTIAALAQSPIQLFNFEFIGSNESSRLVHGGFVPLPGEPIAGTMAAARATIFGTTSKPLFHLVDQEGVVLQSIDLAQAEATLDEFIGSFAVPDVPFRVGAVGQDVNGRSYERLFPTLFRPQSVQVTIDPATDNRIVPIGATTNFTFRVRNFGNPGTFRTRARVTTGFIPPRRAPVPAPPADGVPSSPQPPKPGDLVLDRGATGSFDVHVAVRPNTPEGAEVDLVAAVTNIADSTVTNSATLRLTASGSANLMPLADAGDDMSTVTRNTVILDGSRSTDPDNGPAPLTFDWAEIAGPKIILSGATTIAPTFVPDVAGEYTFALVVDDGTTRSVEDLVTVVAIPRRDDGSLGR